MGDPDGQLFFMDAFRKMVTLFELSHAQKQKDGIAQTSLRYCI